jgi:putative transposase
MTVAEFLKDSQMHPPRLSRLDQIFPGFGIYFITFCKMAKERNAWVGRYVIMPDHLHFFVDCGDEVLLSGWMKSLKNSLSKTLRNLGHSAPHWQKGLFDHLVRSEPSYEQKWQYTRENPVRANLVFKAEDWPYQGEIEPLPFI